MRNHKKLISIIVPMYNESANVPLIYRALADAAKKISYELEFIFVNDGSTDETANLLESLHAKDPRVHVAEFSRNFGKEAAVSAGMTIADGDAVVILDSDLQHPPKLLSRFISKWEAGAEVVVGVRKYHEKIGWFKRYSSTWFYRLLGAMSHTTITPHATDYRLLDRSVVDAFNELTERNRITRGLIDWLGFRRDYVYFVSPARQHGQPTYTYRKLVGLAVNSFTSYSMFPLKIAGYLGVLILLVSAPTGIFVVIERYILHDPFHLRITGTAFLAIILLFSVGIVLACLGLIALYIAQIHSEVTNRPLYILRKNLAEDQDRKTIVDEELFSDERYDENLKVRDKVDDAEMP